MKWVLVPFLGYLTLLIAQSLEQDQLTSRLTCVTPNNKQGVCVKIRSCLLFINALKSGKNESFDFIRKSECGHVDDDSPQPKVCCGEDDHYLNKLTTGEQSGIPGRNPFPRECGVELGQGFRITGGIEADIGEFPWMARLRHLRSDGLLSYGCTGFLISEKFVLTAAHCIRSKTLSQLGDIYQIQLGEHNTETDRDCEVSTCADPPQFLEAAEAIVHPDYVGDSQQHNDIAIIPLKQAAKFTDFVFPICISNTRSHEPTAMVSGWGRTTTNSASPVKLKVQLLNVNKVQCTNVYKAIGILILDSQVCAGGTTGHDACSGDSGGPLMVFQNSAWYAEGVVSFGKRCGDKGWPGIYTSIPHYYSWIRKVLNLYLDGKFVANGPEKKKTDGDYYTWSQ